MYTTLIDRIGRSTHVGFPGIGAGFAAAAGVLFAAEGTADHRTAFTEGEVWRVDRRRIDAALAAGAITAEHAEQFRQQGAIGSHLEILQRDQGYKGFNREGISQIIHGTDPRRQV